jgi:hypothetical protein
MILARKEKPNSQIYKLVINEENIITPVIKGLDDFKSFLYSN